MKTRINWGNTITFATLVIGLLVFPFINPCEHEDSLMCTWNASEQGNHVGLSFTDYYGLTIYLPGK